MQTDVIVVGAGAAGMTAAIVAAKAGLKVMLLEKTEYCGGTMAYSSGAVWIPNNHHQQALGISDSPEQARDYLRSLIGNFYEPDKIDAYLRHGPEMLKFIEANSEVKFGPIPLPDYEANNAGALSGRSVMPETFDGRKLGRRNLARLRPSLPQLSVFGSMQLTLPDLPYFLNVHRSFSGFSYAARHVLAFLRDKLVYGRGARLGNGNATAGRMLFSILNMQIDLRTNVAIRSLIVEDGVVTGVQAEIDGIGTAVTARRGVILAAGGFGGNQQMREDYIPLAEAGPSMQPATNQGDGIKLGIAIGAHMVRENIANSIGTPVSSMTLGNGKRLKFPHLFFDRHSPGTIVVDHAGQRFVNESKDYQHFVMAMQARGLREVYMICDAPAQRRYGMGLAKPFPYPLFPFIRSGYLTQAASIRELAQKLGIDGAALEATVANFNRHAEAGRDPDFHRGDDAYSAFMGDPEHQPNHCLAPLVKAPFYAIKLLPGDISSFCGLATNEHAQVLGPDGTPIPHLYAAGLDMNAVFRGTYPGGGASLGPAMTFGYIAARHLAAPP